MTAHDLYRSPARLPDRRAHLPDLDPDRLVALGWAEYLQGHATRASRTMRAATRRHPDRPYLALNAYLLDDLVRGRRARPQALRTFSRQALVAQDHEAWLLASAHALSEARRWGRPGSHLLLSWTRLADLAANAGARLAPELALRVARTALGLGRLAEAEARARELARTRPRGCEVGIRAHLTAEVARARRVGARPIFPRGLEDLHPLHRLETLLTLADQARGGGDGEAAADYLGRAARVAAARRLPDAAAAVAQRRASLALDAGQVGRAAILLEEAPPSDAPGRALHHLLRSRLAAAQGDHEASASALADCRDDLERQGWCGPLQELALLEADLDPDPANTLRHWRRARRWEDGEARVAMLTILLPRARDRTTFRTLWRHRPDDPRTEALRDRIRGRYDRPVPRDVRGGRIRSARPDVPTLGLHTPEGTRRLTQAEARELRADASWDLLLDLELGRAMAREAALDMRRSARTRRLLKELLTRREGLTVEELTNRVWGRPRVPYETDQLVHSAVYRVRARLPDPDLIEFTEERYRFAPGARVAFLDSTPSAREPK